MPTIGNTRHRSSTVRQPRTEHRRAETRRQGETRQTSKSSRREALPGDDAFLRTTEGFALGAMVGWQLPYLKSKVVLGDRMTELLTPALLLAQGASALSIGVVCGAARLIKGRDSD